MNVRYLGVALLLPLLTVAIPIDPAEDPLSVPIVKVVMEEVPFVVKPVEEIPVEQEQRKAPAPTENDAIALALADVLTLPVEQRRYIRYIWSTDGTFETMQIVSLAMNYVSRATVISRPFPIGKDRLILSRIDLRQYCRTEDELKELTHSFEEFRYDPRFNMLLTKDTLKFASGVEIPKQKKSVTKKKWEVKQVPAFVHTDGHTYTSKWVEVDYTEVIEVAELVDDVLRVISPHLDQRVFVPLIEATGSQAPVISHGYFLWRALSAIQDDGLYKTLYGGLYYDLVGIKTGAKKGTDEDVFFESLGVGNTSQGITAKKIFDSLRSDERVAIFRSGVTGRPRRVDLLRSLAARVGTSQGVLSVTHDLKRKSVDIGQHPMMNLIDFKTDAKEEIFEKANGLHGFALFNGQGLRQDQAPDDVASDWSVPTPHNTVLQPAIGCIRCHAKSSGWQPLTNDVKRMTAKGKIDILNDFSQPYKSRSDILDRLAGLYSGDPEQKFLPRARDDYASAILRATGPWKVDTKGQLEIARLTGDKIADLYKQHVYDVVDARQVLLDNGIEVKEKEDAVTVLDKLLPPVMQIPLLDYIPEDPRIGALKEGMSINRIDYDLIYSFVARRIQDSLKREKR